MELDVEDEMLLDAIAEKYGFAKFLIIGQMLDEEEEEEIGADTMCIVNSKEMSSHDMMRYLVRGMQLMMGYLGEGSPTSH